MNYSSLAKQGIRNAFGVVMYIVVVALFFSNAQTLFGAEEPKGPLVPTMMLLLFVVSALITGTLVLWQPAKLLVDGKKTEAGALLCVTGSSLAVFLVLLIIILTLIQ